MGLGLLVVKTKYANGETVGRSKTQLLFGYGSAGIFLLYLMVATFLLFNNFQVGSWCPGCVKINCLEIDGLWKCKNPVCPVKNVTSKTTLAVDKDTEKIIGLLPVQLDYSCRRDLGNIRVQNLTYTQIPCNSGEFDQLDELCRLKIPFAGDAKDYCWRCQDAPGALVRNTPLTCMCELAACEACNNAIFIDLKRKWANKNGVFT